MRTLSVFAFMNLTTEKILLKGIVLGFFLDGEFGVVLFCFKYYSLSFSLYNCPFMAEKNI